MSLKSDSCDMPSAWASYLVNGDSSGLCDVERAAADSAFKEYAAIFPGFYITGVVEHSERFTWLYELHDSTAAARGISGGNVSTYAFHYEES